jgi:hypothetical protein
MDKISIDKNKEILEVEVKVKKEPIRKIQPKREFSLLLIQIPVRTIIQLKIKISEEKKRD